MTDFVMQFEESLTGFDFDFGEVFEVGSGDIGSLRFDDTLKITDGILGVNTTDKVEADNTLPITSSAVDTVLGNIEVLLKTI